MRRSLVGYSPLLAFGAGILPHGIFELTAVFLATAAMLKVGAQLVTPQPDKSLGEILLIPWQTGSVYSLVLSCRSWRLLLLIEIYITPLLIKLAFPYLIP